MICPGMYRCVGGTCIHQYQVCDGTPDCEAGDDEYGCQMSNCPPMCHCELLYMRCYKLTGFFILSLNMYRGVEISGELTSFEQLIDHDNLIMLNASSCQISMPALTRDASFKSLLYLDLSYNSVSVLTKNMFRVFSNLKQIWLIGNKIRLIQQGAFNSLGLEQLDLSNLHIQHLETGAFEGAILAHLDLSSNNISTLDIAYFDNSTSYVNIENNPLIKLVEAGNGSVMLHTAHEYLCCIKYMFECEDGWELDSVCPLGTNITIRCAICGLIITLLNFGAAVWCWLRVKGRMSIVIGYLWIVISDGLFGICLTLVGMKDISFPLIYIQISDSAKHMHCLYLAGIQMSLLYMISMGRLVVAYTLYVSTKLVGNKGIHIFLWWIPVGFIISVGVGLGPVLFNYIFNEQTVDVTKFCSHLLPVCDQFPLSVSTLVIILINMAISVAELIILTTVLAKVYDSARMVKSAGGSIHSNGGSIKRAIIKKVIRCVISIMVLIPAACLVTVHLGSCSVLLDSLHIKLLLVFIPYVPSLVSPMLIIIR